jgi:RNA polymerase sigma factor (sigma-70 family)
MRGVAAGRDHVGSDPGVGVGLEELFRREYEPMHRLAFTLVRSDAEAEEVVQDAFMAIAGRLDSIENLGGYLRTTVVNGARKRLARRRVHDAFDERVVAPETTRGDAQEYLVDVVDQLPERERVAVVLRYYAGWNATEIGEVLECPSGTVRSLLHRSLEQLRRTLSDG